MKDCPHCGGAMADVADRCPACGMAPHARAVGRTIVKDEPLGYARPAVVLGSILAALGLLLCALIAYVIFG